MADWRWALPPAALAELRQLIGEQAIAYANEAASLAGIQRAALAGLPVSLKELRSQLEGVRDGREIQAAARPHVTAALLIDCGISDPANADSGAVARAASIALDELPPPKRGRPPQPAAPGRDWLEDGLLQLHARLTGELPTSIDAVKCAAVVLVALGLQDDRVDVESIAKRARRRLNKCP